MTNKKTFKRRNLNLSKKKRSNSEKSFLGGIVFYLNDLCKSNQTFDLFDTPFDVNDQKYYVLGDTDDKCNNEVLILKNKNYTTFVNDYNAYDTIEHKNKYHDDIQTENMIIEIEVNMKKRKTMVQLTKNNKKDYSNKIIEYLTELNFNPKFRNDNPTIIDINYFAFNSYILDKLKDKIIFKQESNKPLTKKNSNIPLTKKNSYKSPTKKNSYKSPIDLYKYALS
jgi:hypothetical protein